MLGRRPIRFDLRNAGHEVVAASEDPITNVGVCHLCGEGSQARAPFVGLVARIVGAVVSGASPAV